MKYIVSILLAMPSAQWQGEYHDLTSTRLSIAPAGKFTMETICPYRGDVGIPVTLTGTATESDDGWLHLTVRQRTRECELAARFDYVGVRSGKARFLMTDRDLTVFVNAINNGDTFDGGAALRQAPGGGIVTFDARMPVPPRYRAMLRSAPLSGTVVRVEPTGSEMIDVAGDPMLPAKMKERFAARHVIDRGARQGVFAGMLLYTGQGALRIEQVGDDEATATHR